MIPTLSWSVLSCTSIAKTSLLEPGTSASVSRTSCQVSIARANVVLLSLSQPVGSGAKGYVMWWKIAVEVEGSTVHC
jgi:hypothetical protein